MRIIADENMPFAAEAFSNLGEVNLAPGRLMNAELLRTVDCLAVRSVTRVDSSLLSGSAVKFVGTATIGTDHVDTEYLGREGIKFASAPGCNAISVAEYVIAALFELAGRKGFTLAGKVLGIVGVGNVGSRLESRARALGLEVVLNDPPLADQTGDSKYRPLDELLERSDIVTVHVPLEKAGKYPTYHLVNQSLLASLGPGAVLLNTSRGAVADSFALLAAIGSGKLGAVVLDVWEGEPEIPLDLLRKVDLATPHIAGYSFDGKARGTRMIYEAACRHFGVEPVWTPEGLLPAPENPLIELTGRMDDAQDLLAKAVLESYDIAADDRNLRGIFDLPKDARAKHFDRLRRSYPVRREFASRTVRLGPGLKSLAPVLAGLDFTVETA
ncbi:MAG: 4-phosphoerythronate dehydrogenase PdxB [Candidatus Glassbacteria bacterium]|nr:4-phosphoerythronate dehydrogenase PdxB [Candidatus Glassbacteria bacterium]